MEISGGGCQHLRTTVQPSRFSCVALSRWRDMGKGGLNDPLPRFLDSLKMRGTGRHCDVSYPNTTCQVRADKGWQWTDTALGAAGVRAVRRTRNISMLGEVFGAIYILLPSLTILRIVPDQQGGRGFGKSMQYRTISQGITSRNANHTMSISHSRLDLAYV